MESIKMEKEKEKKEAEKKAAAPIKKKKPKKEDISFIKRKGETLIKMPGDVNGYDFMMKDLEDCTVLLLDHTSQILLDRCHNTKFYIGPVKSSIFFRDCSNCTITVSC